MVGIITFEDNVVALSSLGTTNVVEDIISVSFEAEFSCRENKIWTVVVSHKNRLTVTSHFHLTNAEVFRKHCLPTGNTILVLPLKVPESVLILKKIGEAPTQNKKNDQESTTPDFCLGR